MVATSPAKPRGRFIATVAWNQPLCREHWRLTLKLEHFPETKPGQFIQIACNDPITRASSPDFQWDVGRRVEMSGEELRSPTALLRRPFSLAGRRNVGDRVELDVIHRVVGLGTHWLADLDVLDPVDILGPLGNTFTLPPENHTALLVGGGVGIPPMIYLASALAGRRAVAFAGAVTRDLLPMKLIEGLASSDPTKPARQLEEFATHGIPSVITTDDGSLGFRGYVTQALERYLDAHHLPATIYTCGPEPMMRRVADIAISRGIPCQVAVERAMACGMGTCQSCCIRVKKSDPSKPPLPGRDWCYRLACTDGPVFSAGDLLW